MSVANLTLAIPSSSNKDIWAYNYYNFRTADNKTWSSKDSLECDETFGHLNLRLAWFGAGAGAALLSDDSKHRVQFCVHVVSSLGLRIKKKCDIIKQSS